MVAGAASGGALLGLAAIGLFVVPLAAGATLVLLPMGARLRTAVVVAAVLLLVGGLGCAVAGLAIQGWTEARFTPVGFAPDGWSGLIWTLGPPALSLLFVGIAVWARSWLLAALATAQLILVVPALVGDLGSANEASSASSSLLLDPLSMALLSVSVLVGGLIVIFSLGYEPFHLHHAGQDPRRTGEFIAWLFLFLASMNLLVLADDLRMLAVGWELTTLCSYRLIGFDRGVAPTVAARRALAYNLLGGAGLAAAVWLAGPHAALSDLVAGPSVAWLPAALALLAIAAATKSALAPFHPWLLGAMVAAAPVSALLHASTMVKAGSYLLLRLSPVMAGTWVGIVVATLGAFSFAAAAMLALRERDLKRVLALSTVASLGAIAAAAALGSPLALAAGIVFLVLHAAAKGLAFLVVGSTEQVTGTRDLESLVGLGRARPWLAGPLLLAAAAMALPPFGIAVAKWAILLAGGGELTVILLLAVGAAANVALWTAVAARIIVRRPLDLRTVEPVHASQRMAMGLLTVATAAGLVAAGPLAAVFGDAAAEVAFGQAAPLADGMRATAMGGIFPIVALAAVLVGALAVPWLLVRGMPTAPEPYLSGANATAGSGVGFRGPGGRRFAASSSGFYWGAALSDGGRPFNLRRLVLVAGWVGIGLVAVAGLLGMGGLVP
jgi:ech hydrogenase subunit A